MHTMTPENYNKVRAAVTKGKIKARRLNCKTKQGVQYIYFTLKGYSVHARRYTKNGERGSWWIEMGAQLLPEDTAARDNFLSSLFNA